MEPNDASRSLLRRDQRHARKIMSIAPAIARQQRQPAHSGVDAEEKIRQDPGSRAARLAVLRKDLAGRRINEHRSKSSIRSYRSESSA